MTDEILIDYIEGRLGEREREEIVSWLEASDEHFRRFSALQLERTLGELNREEMTEEEAMERLSAAGWPLHAVKKQRTARAWTSVVSRVAALLLLPLAVASFLVIGRRNAEIARLTAQVNAERIIPIQEDASWLYTVNPGVKGDVTLPDGSRVRLNSASSLRCPDRFSDTCRVVELSGEGFFEVESHPDWPMYVRTSKGATVKVTGTRFNVSSYENDAALKLTLVDGHVTLIDDASGRHFTVEPNEEMAFCDGAAIRPVRRQVDVQPAIVWKDGVLFFENTPMAEVVRRLERWYGVSIDAADPAIFDTFFTASFESESIQQVLQLLKITSNIDYRINGKTVTLRYAPSSPQKKTSKT